MSKNEATPATDLTRAQLGNRNPDDYFEAGEPSKDPRDQHHPGGGPWNENDPDRPSAQVESDAQSPTTDAVAFSDSDHPLRRPELTAHPVQHPNP